VRGEPSRTPPESYSLANFAEILFPCLDAVKPRTVVEVGAFRGDFTRVLLDWAVEPGVAITAIEPKPPAELLSLRREHPELNLVERDSHSALSTLPVADAVIIDGDHNYYTVSEELRLISEQAGDAGLPLLIFHDVCWPHARRDTYYAPERIPEEHRQPLAHDVRLAPGVPGTATIGILYAWAAEREGGPRNGVLTAIEDFVADRDGLRLVIVPAYFGLGLLWPEDAPWADAIARIVEPWDSSPMLERMEEARVSGIIDRMRLEPQEKVLRSLLDSRAFALAERLSNLRQRGTPVFSREQVRRALGE
jgi:Methyltransferase domain